MMKLRTSRAIETICVVGVSLLLAAGCAQREETSPEMTQAQETPPAEQTQQRSETMDESQTTSESESEAVEKSTPSPTETIPSMPGAVRDYIQIAEMEYVTPEGMKKYDHKFTAERFRGLAEALRASAKAWQLPEQKQQTIQTVSDEIKSIADHIQEKRIVPHSGSVRNGFDAGARALNLFVRDNGKLEKIHAELVETAESFDPDVILLNQKKTVTNYFRKTAKFFRELYE